MDILGTIAEKIIQEQEKIIGPIALEQARKVQGLNVDMQKHEVKFTGNEKEILENTQIKVVFIIIIHKQTH